MQGLSNDQQAQFHRLINRVLSFAIDCRAIPEGFCGSVTIDVQYGKVKKTDQRSLLSDDRKAQVAETAQKKLEVAR